MRLPDAEARTGHTPGQIRVDLDLRGKRAIFAGDALHNPVQVPLWKWNSCFCEDLDLARKSRHTLLADCVEQGALLMPAHFAPPHAAYIKGQGRALRARLGLRQQARPLKDGGQFSAAPAMAAAG